MSIILTLKTLINILITYFVISIINNTFDVFKFDTMSKIVLILFLVYFYYMQFKNKRK